MLVLRAGVPRSASRYHAPAGRCIRFVVKFLSDLAEEEASGCSYAGSHPLDERSFCWSSVTGFRGPTHTLSQHNSRSTCICCYLGNEVASNLITLLGINTPYHVVYIAIMSSMFSVKMQHNLLRYLVRLGTRLISTLLEHCHRSPLHIVNLAHLPLLYRCCVSLSFADTNGYCYSMFCLRHSCRAGNIAPADYFNLRKTNPFYCPLSWVDVVSIL